MLRKLGRLKGEMEAIEQASIRKNCGIQFKAGCSTVASSRSALACQQMYIQAGPHIQQGAAQPEQLQPQRAQRQTPQRAHPQRATTAHLPPQRATTAHLPPQRATAAQPPPQRATAAQPRQPPQPLPQPPQPPHARATLSPSDDVPFLSNT